MLPYGRSVYQRAATFSYSLAEEVHSLLDDSPAPFALRRLEAVPKRATVSGLVFFGVLVATLTKMVYQVEAKGRNEVVHPFEKPWFMVLLMFTGMFMCLPLSLFLDLLRCSKPRHMGYDQMSERIPLLYEQADDGTFQLAPAALETPPALYQRQFLLMLMPTLLDLAGSVLLNIGLLFVTASAAQMLRGSLLLFGTALAVVLYQKPLNSFHGLGLLSCLAGLALVALASCLSGDGAGQVMVGVALVIASQLVQALQLLLDGSVNSKLTLSPLKVVGCEGLLGLMCTAFIILPILAHIPAHEGHGLREDTIDTLLLIWRSRELQVLLVLQCGAMQLYNICGMALSGELSSAEASSLQATRTALVWLVNILLHLLGPLGLCRTPFGEALNRWALLQAAGFALLVGSHVVFAKGDEERLRKQMAAEAALILLDRPASRQSSVHGSMLSGKGGRFRASSDIGGASVMGSFWGLSPTPGWYTNDAASSRTGGPYVAIPVEDPNEADLGAAVGPSGMRVRVEGAGMEPQGIDGSACEGHSHSLPDSLVSWPQWALTPPSSSLHTPGGGEDG